jgi:YD repeat-containing protein
MRASIVRRGRHVVGSRNRLSRRLPRVLKQLLLTGVGLAGLTPALATDTVSYVYDARGRLVQVRHSGTAPNNGVSATYTYDRADNRTSVVVATTPSCAGVTFAVGDASATEGGPVGFVITKSGSTANNCTVNYSTANGTAVSPADYTPATGTVTFAAADTSKSVPVVTIDDSSVEGPETLILNLSAASGAALITDQQAVGTINDNDFPPPCSGVNFTVASGAAVTEGGNVTFTLTKHGTATGTCAVDYATANGTAVAPGDYTSASGTLTFTSAQTTNTASVSTIDDSGIEPAETFSLALSSPTNGATLGSPASATGTINDNDQVKFSISDSQANEGNPLVFEVTKSGVATGPVSVQFGSSDGTAVAGQDYIGAFGTLTFAVTDTVKTITVQTVADAATFESDETMDVGLFSPTGGAIITDGDGVGTIFNDAGSGGGGGGCGRTCLQTNGSTTSAPSTTTTNPAPPPTDPATTTDPSTPDNPPPPGE